VGRFETEKEFLEFFDESFPLTTAPVVREIEYETLGTDYGASSWSPAPQIDTMIEYLAIESGSSYLDIGAGTGWPGLYVAEKTGCALTMLDYPTNGLILAMERAEQDGADAMSVSGDAARMPLASGIFDAVSHSDVMCCLSRKAEALAECRRVSSDEGAISFTVIEMTAGLPATDLALASEAGPEFVGSEVPYLDLLEASGWRQAEAVDLTAEMGLLAQSILAARTKRKDRLVDLLGEEDVELSLERATKMIKAIGDGLIRRYMYLARA